MDVPEVVVDGVAMLVVIGLFDESFFAVVGSFFDGVAKEGSAGETPLLVVVALFNHVAVFVVYPLDSGNPHVLDDLAIGISPC